MMKENAWVYLYDKDGNTVEPDTIPSNLADLQDDKYQSLAWAVLEAGGYQKSDVPFQEFSWGNYFRQHLTFPVKSLKIAANPLYETLREHRGHAILTIMHL